ncbi:MAG: hypothetical protein ACTFAK_10390 [Candidatus Electronema sp. VV]
MIANFPDRICSNIRLEGSGSAVELNGEAKAELKGLFKKFANLGIGGTGKYKETAWSGVLQKDIANPSCAYNIFFNAVSQDKKKNFQFKAMRGDSMNMRWKSLGDDAEC